MEDLKFNSLNDLYNRLLPALKTKKDELKRDGINYVMEEDIWNYLKEYKWSKANNLELHNMVDNILFCENAELEEYTKSKLATIERTISKDEEIL